MHNSVAAALREKMGGMTQAHAADQLGVTQATVSRWVHGGKVKNEHVPNIARFLEVDMDHVLKLMGHGDRLTGDV